MVPGKAETNSVKNLLISSGTVNDVLEEASIGGEGVESGVRFTLDADGTADGEANVLTSVASSLVDLADGDLN